MKDKLTLIFGSSVHRKFECFLDLYKGVRKFYGDPLYLYASNEGLGQPSGNLVNIKARRSYRWRRSHNFIFDAAEALKGRYYDYFIALDSDCLVCGDSIKEFLNDNNIDFVVYPNLNGIGKWYHGNVFMQNIGHYLGILEAIGIKRRDETVVGNFNPLIMLSKRSVDFLRDNLEKIEASKGYEELMKLDFSVGETLIFNLLKDAGFKMAYIELELKRGLRYRPHWRVSEYSANIPIYHPVRLKSRDLFRRFVGIRCGYDKNYLYLPLIYAARLYGKVRSLFFGRRGFPKEEDTWFNA